MVSLEFQNALLTLTPARRRSVIAAFQHQIDEVVAYTRALSSEERLALCTLRSAVDCLKEIHEKA